MVLIFVLLIGFNWLYLALFAGAVLLWSVREMFWTWFKMRSLTAPTVLLFRYCEVTTDY